MGEIEPHTATELADTALDVTVLYGSIRYHPATRVLVQDGEEFTLEPKLGQILSMLSRADGPVSRQHILDELWGFEGSDEALTQAISRLRRAFGDTTRPYKFITTLPGDGYQLNVRPVYGQQIASRHHNGSGLTTILSFTRSHRSYLTGFVSGFVFFLVLLAGWVILHPPVEVNKNVYCDAGSTNPECVLASETMNKSANEN